MTYSDTQNVSPNEQLLARRGVVAARHIREPAVPHVEPIDDREAKWIRGLNSRQNPSERLSAHTYHNPEHVACPIRSSKMIAPSRGLRQCSLDFP